MNSNNENEHSINNSRKNIIVSNDIRRRIIDNYLNDKSIKEISEIFNLNISTIQSIVRVYINENRICKKPMGVNRRKILNEQHINFIKELIDADITISLRKIKEEFLLKYDEFNNISLSTIQRSIKGFYYTLKRISLVPETRNSIINIEKRKIYAREFEELKLEVDDINFIYLDEIGFNVTMHNCRGRSLIGTRANLNVPKIKTRNITVIACMNKNGMINFKINNHALNGVDFTNYLYELKNIFHQKNIPNPIIFLDNAKPHHFNIAVNMADSLELRLIFIPPYSPFLNPIENIFNKWKQSVKGFKVNSERELFIKIEESYLSINRGDCLNCYLKMLRYIRSCLSEEIILQ